MCRRVRCAVCDNPLAASSGGLSRITISFSTSCFLIGTCANKWSLSSCASALEMNWSLHWVRVLSYNDELLSNQMTTTCQILDDGEVFELSRWVASCKGTKEDICIHIVSLPCGAATLSHGCERWSKPVIIATGGQQVQHWQCLKQRWHGPRSAYILLFPRPHVVLSRTAAEERVHGIKASERWPCRECDNSDPSRSPRKVW